jgi:hypothetical protein
MHGGNFFESEAWQSSPGPTPDWAKPFYEMKSEMYKWYLDSGLATKRYWW